MYGMGGARCYLFQGNALFGMRQTDEPQKVDYDYQALYSLGARYLISSVRIDLASNPFLQQINITGRESEKESFWEKIYVYTILNRK